MGWLSLVGMGVSALAQHSEGQDAKAAANLTATGIESEAQDRAGKIRKLAAQARGTARSQLGASGVDPNSGTATLIDQQIQGDAESDVNSTILSGLRQAYAVRRGGQIQQQAANINAVGTVVNGVSSESGRSTLADGVTKYRNWKTAKTTGSGVGA